MVISNTSAATLSSSTDDAITLSNAVSAYLWSNSAASATTMFLPMSWSNTWSDSTSTTQITVPIITTDTNSNATTSIVWLTTSYENYIIPTTPPTPEQIEATRVRLEIEREAKDTARARAEALLNRHLSENQRKTLKEHGWVLVTARSTGNRYRVYRGRSHNVKKLDAHDREVQSLCAHPTMLVPEADCMLSQMLMLELMEDRFLTLANKRDIARPVNPHQARTAA